MAQTNGTPHARPPEPMNDALAMEVLHALGNRRQDMEPLRLCVRVYGGEKKGVGVKFVMTTTVIKVGEQSLPTTVEHIGTELTGYDNVVIVERFVEITALQVLGHNAHVRFLARKRRGVGGE